MNFRRSLMKRLIRLTFREGLLKNSASGALRLLGYTTVDAAPYQNGASVQLPAITGVSVSQVTAPQELGAEQKIIREELPPISPLIFSDVVVRSDSSVLCQDGYGLMPSLAFKNKHRVSWENGRSCAFDADGRLVFENRPQEQIVRGICGFAEASYNWYHWLIEILPMIMVAGDLGAEYADWPLLVPEEAFGNATFRETLDLFRGNREVVALRKTHQYRIGELLFCPPPVFGPFNMQRGHWPEPSDYSQNLEVMKSFRSAVLEKLAVTARQDGPRRVFLARPSDVRQYNQDDIIAAARKKDFHIVYLEKLSFREQVQILHDADIVVGPSGAAWAGSLFMRPGTKGLIWVHREYMGGSFFSNLTCASGSQLTYLPVDSSDKISGTRDTAKTAYTLPVDSFVAHVDALTG
ncbi:DUF563 domain-containing protein [uncultured Roseobacter sp.]|uniref:glycosyltransferase family 61 protein n=1 Tax=uncultured Roseobacter sp. TaxID=114847 RepID=UPI0026368BB7|nr:glycosyltransferase family 61 protein [uncultured Roseobacter sp.]